MAQTDQPVASTKRARVRPENEAICHALRLIRHVYRLFLSKARVSAMRLVHRTGILHRLEAGHAYGPACYRPRGCAEIIATVAQRIDAREFTCTYPQTFPRFVQLAIWEYCSQDGLDICNGNRINDRERCSNTECSLYSICDRNVLYKLCIQ